MHVSIECGWDTRRDVSVPDGVPFADIEPWLRAMAGAPAGSAARADSHLVGHGARCGQFPLLEGCVVTWRHDIPDPMAAAAGAPWHWAAVSGGAVGQCVALRARPAWTARMRARWARLRVRGLPQGCAFVARRRPGGVRESRPAERTTRSRLARLAPLAGTAVAGIVMAVVFTNPVMLVFPLVSIAAGLGTWSSEGRRAAGRERRRNDPSCLAMRSAGPGLWQRELHDGHLRSHVLGIDMQAGDVLAFTGPRSAALSLAHTVVLEAVVSYPPSVVHVEVGDAQARGWAWSRWLPHRSFGIAAPQPLTPAHGGPHHVAVVVGDGQSRTDAIVVAVGPVAPAHATFVLDARPGRREGLCDVSVPHSRRVARIRTAPPQVCEDAARRLAKRLPNAHLTDTLRQLSGAASPQAIARRWRTGSGVPVVGTCPDGTAFQLDLNAHGPHLLVGGTTGSGKSQLLRTVVLAAALQYPPDRLTVIALDHKGGATFADLAGLPHLAALVTDLDIQAAGRAIGALGAELRRREEVLAQHGCVNAAQLRARGVVLPKLLVVIDEFRALADDLPDFVPSLVRLAAQGRSLGMHLILATQRPGGAISPDMRANIATRIACRVADCADSQDLIGSAAAAALPVDSPGSALMTTGGAPQPFKVAFGHADAVRTVREATWPTRWDSRPAPIENDQALVADIAAAAALLGLAPAAPVWLEPLPNLVAAAALSPVEPGLVALALADLPGSQRREVRAWDPARGHLMVVGAPGSGLTTTARAAALGAMRAGFHVHVLAAVPAQFADLESHQRCGTVVGPGDSRRLGRLLAALRTQDAKCVVIIDGADAFMSPDAPCAPLLRGVLPAPSGGPAVVACGSVSLAGGRWAAAFTTRLVLPTADTTDDVAVGVPRDLAGPRPVPGRAIWRDQWGSAICQVALPNPLPYANLAPGESAPVRLQPVPLEVDATALPRTQGHRCCIGVGGDSAEPLWLDLSPGARYLVAGGPGSGRTSALRLIVRRAPTSLLPAVWVNQAETTWIQQATSALTEGRLVVIDDLDPTAQLSSDLPATGVVVAACGLDQLSHGARGLAAVLARSRCAVLFGTPAPASAPILGVDLRPYVDPMWAGYPGRGVLLDGQGVRPLQCAKPG